jgi:hypothetical protein
MVATNSLITLAVLITGFSHPARTPGPAAFNTVIAMDEAYSV